MVGEVGTVGDISSSCASSKSHCGYPSVSMHDGSSRNDPSNSSNLALQHPAQFRGPVDAQLLPGSIGGGFTSSVSPVPPATLTNLQRWRPLPSSFLARLRRRRSQSESALRYREHPNFLSRLTMLKHWRSSPSALLMVHSAGRCLMWTRCARRPPLHALLSSTSM